MQSEKYAAGRGGEEHNRLSDRMRKWGRMAMDAVLGNDKNVGAGEIGKENMLDRVMFEGDPMIDEYGRERVLTREWIEKIGLEPKHKMELEGTKIGFSEVFDIGDGREACLGYVDAGDGEAWVRGYYKSNSQGLWRYLPGRVTQRGGGDASWYGKGQDESAITLPSGVQAELAKWSVVGKDLTRDAAALQRERRLAFLATATEIKETEEEWTEKRERGEIRDAFGREVAKKAKVDFTTDLPPEKIDVRLEKMPDYGEEKQEYRTQTSKYGEVVARTFDSRDRSLRYTMMEDARGVVWVGQIEAINDNSYIGSTGLRSQWVKGGALAVPAYEYPSQAGIYGDTSDVKLKRNGSVQYVSMWRNYLSKIPMIKQYKEHYRRV